MYVKNFSLCKPLYSITCRNMRIFKDSSWHCTILHVQKCLYLKIHHYAWYCTTLHVEKCVYLKSLHYACLCTTLHVQKWEYLRLIIIMHDFVQYYIYMWTLIVYLLHLFHVCLDFSTSFYYNNRSILKACYLQRSTIFYVTYA